MKRRRHNKSGSSRTRSKNGFDGGDNRDWRSHSVGRSSGGGIGGSDGSGSGDGRGNDW